MSSEPAGVFETGSWEFSRLGARPPILAKDSKKSTKGSESMSHRWSSKIPDLCFWPRKCSKGKKLACYKVLQGGGILLFHTALGLNFYGGKILTQSECWDHFWWLGSERGQKRGIRDNTHNFFLLPLAKRLPVNQTLWEERQKTNIPILPLQPFSVSFKPNSQIHLVADLMSPRC